ncbi:MAG: response regulator [Rhizobacter sp.]|nr:response regulator [Rhizobacter sp.]
MQTTPAILIVDDNAANRRLYQASLNDMGAEIYSAASGEEALARCGERHYAMILLDVHLSGMSGFDVAQTIRDKHVGMDAPIVFVSAMYVHESDTYRGYRLGAVDYILSPVVPEILRAKAAVFIRLHRMRMEAQQQAQVVEKAYRELRTVHSEMEGFSYSVSHDLRTPLGQVAGFADLLQLGHAGELSTKAREYVGHIQTAAQRMNSLIEDMLLLANMTRAEMQVQPVDLSHMANVLLEELAAAKPLAHAESHVQAGLHAQGDARLLRVALSNLLSNAWKYSAGVPRPQVEFGQVERPEGAVFYVRDNGAGFDARAAGERLFRPFQRFHPDSAFKGNGVGLAIVERVLEKHGGRIWVESAPGQGACFFFTLGQVSSLATAIV